MKRLFRYILTIVFIGYLLFALAWGARSARRQEYKGLCVTVVDSMRAQYISTAEILRLLKGHIEWEEGTPLAKINMDELEALLYKNSLIKEAKCYTTPSGLLRIDVSQRRPIMRIFGNNGSYFLDESGSLIDATLFGAVSVPVATGYISTEYARQLLYPFACFLQKHPFWWAQIEQICVDNRQQVELIPRVGDQRILIGELTAYEEKLNNLRCLYEQAFSKCGWNKYTVINLKYKDQVVCTRRK